MRTERKGREGDNKMLSVLKLAIESTDNNNLSASLSEYLQNNKELWSDAHEDDFYTFAQTLAKEWLSSHKGMEEANEQTDKGQKMTKQKMTKKEIKKDKDIIKEAIANNAVGEIYSRDGLRLLKVLGNPERVVVKDGVRVVCQKACMGLESLKEVVLPASVTKLGTRAFAECSNLVKVTMPGVEIINPECFYICESLKDVTLPITLREIRESAFYYCKALEKINIPRHLKAICCMAFNYSGLKDLDIEISDGYTCYIYEFAFYQCKQLKTVRLNVNVTIAGCMTFADCPSLKTIVLKNTVLLENAAVATMLAGCTALERIIVPKDKNNDYPDFNNQGIIPIGVRTRDFNSLVTPRDGLINKQSCILTKEDKAIINEAIANDASGEIYSDDGLRLLKVLGNPERVEVKDGVKVVCSDACQGLDCLREVVMPLSVTELGNRAFAECRNLVKVTMPGVESIAAWCFYHCENLKEVALPFTLRGIWRSAFSGCKALEQIKIPRHLKTIDCYAFQDSGLKDLDIEISDGYKCYIDYRSFSDCKNLETVRLDRNVLITGNMTFAGCTALKTIEFRSIRYIGGDEAVATMLLGCTALENIILSKSICNSYPNFNIQDYETDGFETRDFNSLVATKDGLINGLRTELTKADKKIVKRAIKNRVSGEIYSADGLRLLKVLGNPERVEVKDGVKAVCEYSFFGLDRLREVILPASVVDLGASAFEYCRSLSEIIMPGVEYIGDECFSSCKSLKDIVLPETLDRICASAFAWCKALEAVNIPSCLTVIDKCAFLHSGLKSVDIDISDGYTCSISSGVFFRCENMETARLNKNVRIVGKKTFAGCSALKSIEFEKPSMTCSCGEPTATMLVGCTALEKIVVPKSESNNCPDFNIQDNESAQFEARDFNSFITLKE